MFQYFLKKFINSPNITEYTEDSLVFQLNQDDSTAVVISYQNNNLPEVTIPSYVNYHSHKFTVIGLKSKSFSENENLKKIIFPEDSKVEFLEDNTFGNSKIESITIPSSVKKIDSCFENCTNLVKIIFPEDSELQYINANIFESTNINSIFFPKNISKIDGIFNCRQIKSIFFDEDSKIESLPEHLFAKTQISEITIPKNIKKN